MVHRIRGIDGKWRNSKYLHVVSTVSYVLFAATGVLFLISDLLIPVYGLSAEAMAWFLIVGGLCSAFGAATLRWWGEFVGLPPLGTALTVLGLHVWYQSHVEAPWLAAGNLVMLVGMALFITLRWYIVWTIYRLAKAAGEEDQGVIDQGRGLENE